MTVPFEPILFDKLGEHIGHTLSIVPIGDEASVFNCQDEQRMVLCEDCSEVLLVVDNPEGEVEGS